MADQPHSEHDPVPDDELVLVYKTELGPGANEALRILRDSGIDATLISPREGGIAETSSSFTVLRGSLGPLTRGIAVPADDEAEARLLLAQWHRRGEERVQQIEILPDVLRLLAQVLLVIAGTLVVSGAAYLLLPPDATTIFYVLSPFPVLLAGWWYTRPHRMRDERGDESDIDSNALQ